jgi:hypothetical protein
MTSMSNIFDQFKIIEKYFGSYIIDSNYIQNRETISWSNFISGMGKSLYAKDYQKLLNNRQYSFLLVDKSFLQFYYEFDSKHGLKTVKLCYYPYPIKLREDADHLEKYFTDSDDTLIGRYYFDLWNLISRELGYKTDERFLEATLSYFKSYFGYEFQNDEIRNDYFDQVYTLTNYSHFRMDYDATVTSHHKCEFQIGAIKKIRLPLDRILDPIMFIDLIFKWFFREDHNLINSNKKYRSKFLTSKRSTIPIPKFKEDSIFNTLK